MTNQFISLHQAGNHATATARYQQWLQARLELPAEHTTFHFTPTELPTSSTDLNLEEQRRLVDVLNQHTFPNTREDTAGRAEAHAAYLHALRDATARADLFQPYTPAGTIPDPIIMSWFHIGHTPRTLFAYKQGAYLIDEPPVGHEPEPGGWEPDLCEPADLNLWEHPPVERLFAVPRHTFNDSATTEETEQILQAWLEQHVTRNSNQVADGSTVTGADLVFRYAEESEYGKPALREVWLDPFTKDLYQHVIFTRTSSEQEGRDQQWEESWQLCHVVKVRTEHSYVLFPRNDNPHTNPSRYQNFTRPQYTPWPASFQGVAGSI